ncbi:Acg family FMN-binding oxidoreductase [Pseudonocardia endophytica]|uniref:Nitroreductase family protein n=1 Tax=Pseudonocardia endophytica TaxID=401976 RepID=A0A4R1HQI0_PSEEN|nr:nitroreductase family protein [Pseudonocardia endophytica]TCK22740.1 nitroreductase family protein [Pseudonocardia endophytica]
MDRSRQAHADLHGTTDVVDLAMRALELAVRAPSLHNTQPWRWRVAPGRVELHADRGRRLHETDPDCRDLLISCGAALHHLHVALAGLGTASRTDRWPDVEDRDHLATVRLVPGPPDQDEAALAPAIRRRRTDRRAHRPIPVPPAVLETLGVRAARHGVQVRAVAGAAGRACVDGVLGEAADAQRRRPGYLAELMTWTSRYAGARDGVPARVRPARSTATGPQHRFPTGRLTGPTPLGGESGTLVVLTTEDDDDRSRLAAGEATSAVLLEATRAGLATAPLSQALELPGTRARLAREALHVADHPQMIIRLGWPVDDVELPATPRRPPSSVLLPP